MVSISECVLFAVIILRFVMDIQATGSRIASRTEQCDVTRKELFLVLHRDKILSLTLSQCNKHLFEYILNKLSLSEYSEKFEKTVKNVLKVFTSKLMSRWRKSRRFMRRFFNKNSMWLDSKLNLPMPREEPATITPKRSARGRPRKPFNDSSEKTKTRTVEPLMAEISPEHLLYATQKSLKMTGKRSAAEVVKLATTTGTPKRLKRMKAAYTSSSSAVSFKPYTPEEALALILDCNLGKEQYIGIQQGAKKRGANIYPSYKSISKIKHECYPEGMVVTETEAKIPLQSLLDLTTKRLVKVQGEVLSTVPEEVKELNIIYKWGMDGSGGHSIYKQNFANKEFEHADSNIILCTVVPLEIFAEITRNENRIYWKNHRTSTTRYCRPIAFTLKKETSENVKQLFIEIDEQITKLAPTTTSINNKNLSFKHILLSTMFDGKTCNILCDNPSTQTCYICRITPKDMNNLNKVLQQDCDTTTYKFGLSVLHSYIRFFEFLLHIAYKLELKQWQARGTEAKNCLKQRKSFLTQKFYDEMGLVVDLPKQGGGNSNDGNTARRFFGAPEKVAEITGLDVTLIKRFGTILSAMSSGYYINVPAFKEYCLETAKLLIQLYNWYNMSPTVHKVLIHGADIIESMILPVGQLSEDAQESRQKDYKNIRQFHTRKTSRVNTNIDLINMLLLSSDPILTSLRKVPRKKQTSFSKDVLSLLKTPDFLHTADLDDNEDDNNDSDYDDESVDHDSD